MFNIMRTFVPDLYLSSINLGRVDEIQTEFGLEFAFGYAPFNLKNVLLSL